MQSRLALSAAVLFTFSLFAQTPDTATLRGHVTDPSHAVVSAAHIAIVNSLTGAKREAQTDPSGAFSFGGLPIAGAYDITAGKQGFGDSIVAGTVLAGGTTAEVTIELSVAGGQERVTVTGSAGEVRADQPQLGARLIAGQIEETPLPNRRISYLPLLDAANRPAINQGDVFMNQDLFTSNGAGRRQSTFVVDGATDNDSWGRQTMFSAIPLAAVQEMTVLQNTFSAEFGGSTGTAVNVVTRSGGNQLHGEVLEMWRPSAAGAALSGFTNTNAASGNDISSDSLGQTAASLFGALGSSGRTHFFLSGEDTRQNRVSPIISPVAPGSFVGHYRGWLGFLRVDHQINDKNTLFFRSLLDGFHDTNPNGTVGGNNLPTVDRVFRRRTYSEELGETAVFGPNLLNSLRVQFQLASPITEFDPVIYGTQFVVPVSTGGTFTSGTSQSALLLNRQYQVNDTISTVRGRHQLKFGADVIVAHTGGNSKEFGGPIYLGQFTYNACTAALTVCESPAYLNNIANVRSYTQSYGNANYTVNDTLWAAFVQDDFRVSRNLTINLGLRYEQQTFTDSRLNFAPRVGFAWNVRGDGKTVIRSGFGIYYSQIIDNSQANYALTGTTGVFNYTATPGQIGFPTSIAAAPLPAFPAGAVTPLRSLYVRPGDPLYPNAKLLNPYSEQWTFGIQQRLAHDWVLSVDYVGSHTVKINRPLDIDAPTSFIRNAPGQVRTAQAANCTRPYWIAFYAQNGLACNPLAATNPQPAYSVIQTDVHTGLAHYNALDLNVTREFRHGVSMLASYTWSHTTDTVDPDYTAQNPNDPNFTGKVENASAIFDQRHRFVLSGVWIAPLKISVGGVTTVASGLPYNIVTGVNNSGDTGATTDRPVINGVVIGRNAGRGTAIYDVAPFIERSFPLFSERYRLTLRAEAFNVTNHANFVGFSGTYGNGATAGAGFGQPLAGITAQLPARSLQFSGRFNF